MAKPIKFRKVSSREQKEMVSLILEARELSMQLSEALLKHEDVIRRFADDFGEDSRAAADSVLTFFLEEDDHGKKRIGSESGSDKGLNADAGVAAEAVRGDAAAPNTGADDESGAELLAEDPQAS